MNWLYFNLPYQINCGAFVNKLLAYDCPIWLDSCSHATAGRFDIISAAPIETLEQSQTDVIKLKNQLILDDDKSFIEHLHLLVPTEAAKAGDFVFSGTLGYFSYEYGVKQHQLSCQNKDLHDLPQAWFGIYNWAVISDHHLKTSTLVYRNISQSLLSIEEIKNLWLSHYKMSKNNFCLKKKFISNISFAEYQNDFSKIKQHIHNGDTYQVNYSHCFSAPFEGDSFDAYMILRQKNPSEFAVFLRLKQGDILSFSPELLVRGDQKYIQTKPIKGTAARVFDVEQDSITKQDLHKCPKNRAENLMIVDLLRNDLSKIAKISSVKVEALFDVEILPSVFHLISTVSAQLDKENNYFDVINAVFPGGSITGAPKYRTMQLIEQYEKYKRSIYCGSIGHLSVEENMCFNIAIRTMTAVNGYLYCSAGGGIVLDSICHLEYQETLDKVSLLTNTLNNI